eukprot:5930702-Amphidinium_carterae.1
MPGSNHQVRVGDSLQPHVPNRYVRCGALTTVGGDIICLKCARTHVWIRTEDWHAPSDQLGQVWAYVPQQEAEVLPGTDVTMQQLDEMGPIEPDLIPLSVSLAAHQCWFPGCVLVGFQRCERRNCRRYACGAHSFSIFLPDGSMTAIWCSAHRKPMISNRYMPYRKKSCCKCGSDSNV